MKKKLSRTSKGSNVGILRQVTTSNVRPIAEYAFTSWITATRTSTTKLVKVQNSDLRIILGAMKTTPIVEIKRITNLEPLETKGEYKALVQAMPQLKNAKQNQE